jgi:polyketide synthase PksJ
MSYLEAVSRFAAVAGGIRSGSWRTIKATLSGKDTKKILGALSEQNGVSEPSILLAGFSMLLHKYMEMNFFCIQMSPVPPIQAKGVFLLDFPITQSSSISQVSQVIEQRLRELETETCQPELHSKTSFPPFFVSIHKAEVVDNDRELIEYPDQTVLGLVCFIGDHASDIKLSYREDALDSWFAEQVLHHFLVILDSWLNSPSISGERLMLLNETEKKHLLEFCQGESRPYPFHKKLYQLFEERAARFPDRIALIGQCEDGRMERMSYQTVNFRANLLAYRLLELGVTADAAVGVHLKRSVYLVIVILAIWKAGGVYIPLDSTYPDEYLRFILNDTNAAVLITEEESSSVYASKNIPILNLAEIDWSLSLEGLANPINKTQTTDTCLIMYTSGSTGKPKGVKHCQIQILNRLYWMWEDYPFQEGDVIAQRSPMNVMPSIWELLGGLLFGLPTVIVPDQMIRKPPELAQYLAEQGVTHITFTPTLLRLLLAAKNRAAIWPNRLRMAIIGGEHVTDSLYRSFRDSFPNTVLVNDFGATEVNTILHAKIVPSQHEEIRHVGYVPIANVAVYVLDDALQPVPYGVKGELHVSGACLAQEYLNLPEATSERFLVWQYEETVPVQRLYRTGDMGYVTPDGCIHITGRRDHQVKVNGMRVELGEIEEILRSHPGIDECAVVDRQLANGKTVLHAYLTTNTGRVLESAQLHAFLHTQLPIYMIPRRFEWLDELPRRPNGKVDRIALQQKTFSLDANRGWITEMASLGTIKRQLRRTAADLLEVPPEEVRDRDAFAVLGFDSVSLIEFAHLLSEEFNLSLSVSTFFDHPNIEKLGQFIAETLGEPSERHIVQTGSGVNLTSAKDNVYEGKPDNVGMKAEGSLPEIDRSAIAVIGMSGRFPGAKTIGEFWLNLCNGLESITEVPNDRWEPESIFDPDPASERRSYSKWGGFLQDIDEFEPLFFTLSPSEARFMDPQQRLCLMEAWRALEDAGYTADNLPSREVGVFVGAREADYPKLIESERVPPNAETLLGNDISLLAARISYVCNLQGPSLVVNTACSSSLVALHLACQSLRTGDCKMALVGGVSVTNDPDFYVATSKLNVFSPTGHCRAFDDSADGFVHGEGVVFVVLKPLPEALAEGDHIYAVIRGTAINQDGRSNGITAPSGAAQNALQETLYRRLEIDPDTIGYVEAHGTGTRLGDLIEMQSLTKTFRRFTQRKQYCAIGSVKTNIGHLTAAAGLTGLVKTVLSLYHEEMVPSLNFQKPNSLVDFADSPFFVNTQRQPWDGPPGRLRRAALNSFGIGGTNAHCVLEEAPTIPTNGSANKPAYLIPVTARTAASLHRRLTELLEWLGENNNRHSLRDVAFTMLAGRKFFDNGYLFVVTSLEDLESQIRTFANGSPSYVHRVSAANPSDELHLQGKRLLAESRKGSVLPVQYVDLLHRLARLIADGFRPDWKEFFLGEPVRRVPMPVYPFDTQSCWVSTRKQPAWAPQGAETKHPSPESLRIPSGQDFSPGAWISILAEAAGEQLGMDASLIHPEESLEKYGFDSVKALALKYKLENQLGVEIQVADLLEFPSLRAMAERLAPIHGGSVTQNFHTNSLHRADLVEGFIEDSIDLSTLSEEELNEIFAYLHHKVGVPNEG